MTNKAEQFFNPETTPATGHDLGANEFDVLDQLDFEAAEAKAAEAGAGGGEALSDGEADCEGCKI